MLLNAYMNWKSRVAKEVDELEFIHTTEREKSRWVFIKKRSDFTKNLKEKSTVIFELMMEETHLADVLVERKVACVLKMTTSNISSVPNSPTRTSTSIGHD